MVVSKRKKSLLQARESYLHKIKKTPELYYIVDYKSQKNDETCLQMSIKSYNSILKQLFSCVNDDLDPVKVKYALSFTKNISTPENVIKPAIK